MVFTSTKLRQVVGIDRAGSLSAASRQMNISQSTLTKALADVENDLGMALFLRTARGVVATREGREFLARAERIVADFDMLIEDAKSQRSDGEMVLRLGIAPASQEGLYNHAISQLLREWPDITLHVTGASVERGVRLLKRGDVDLLFAPIGELEHEAEFDTQKIARIPVGLFCRKGHPLVDPAMTEADFSARLKDFTVISPDLFGGYARRISELMLVNGSHPRTRMHIIENFAIVTNTVAQTDLIGIVGTPYAGTRKFRECFELIGLGLVPDLEIGAARLARWHPSRSVRACLGVVERVLPNG